MTFDSEDCVEDVCREHFHSIKGKTVRHHIRVRICSSAFLLRLRRRKLIHDQVEIILMAQVLTQSEQVDVKHRGCFNIDVYDVFLQ